MLAHNSVLLFFCQRSSFVIVHEHVQLQRESHHMEKCSTTYDFLKQNQRKWNHKLDVVA